MRLVINHLLLYLNHLIYNQPSSVKVNFTIKFSIYKEFLVYK